MTSIIAHPVVVTALAFVRRQGLRISEPTIRAAFADRVAKRRLDLAELIRVFHAIGIPIVPLRRTAEALRTLPLPVIILLAKDDRIPVTLLAFEGDGVRLAHPLVGEICTDWKDFAESWAGVVLALPEGGAGAEPAYEARAAADRASCDTYRRSIRVVDNWATPKECGALIEYCEGQALFRRSMVRRQEALELSFASANRTSASALIADRGAPLVATLLSRAAALAGVAGNCIEDPQCVRYHPGQRFDAHVDGAHRTYTLLVYLNEGFGAGETRFPDLDLAVEPRVGRALLFRNVDRSGAEIPWSRHIGTAPSRGIKYACNLWVRCNPAHVAPFEDGAETSGR